MSLGTAGNKIWNKTNALFLYQGYLILENFKSSQFNVEILWKSLFFFDNFDQVEPGWTWFVIFFNLVENFPRFRLELEPGWLFFSHFGWVRISTRLNLVQTQPGAPPGTHSFLFHKKNIFSVLRLSYCIYMGPQVSPKIIKLVLKTKNRKTCVTHAFEIAVSIIRYLTIITGDFTV